MSASRPPRQPPRLVRRMAPERDASQANLDGVRAIAVLMVVVIHAWGFTGAHAIALGPLGLTWAAAGLTSGANIFFMLSGFLISQPWFRAELTARPRPRVGAYWRRRLTRIVPAYYLSIVVVLAVFLPLGRIPREAVTGWLGLRSLGGQVLFLQGIYPVSSGNLNGVNGVYWTLTVEILLYLILPAAVWLFMGRRWRWTLLAALVFTTGWSWLASKHLDPLVHLMARSVEQVGPTVSVPTGDAYARQLLHLSLAGFAFTFALGIAMSRLWVWAETRPRSPRTVFFASTPAVQPWPLRPRVGRAAFAVGVICTCACMIGSHAVSVADPDSAVPIFVQVVPLSASLALVLYGVVFAGVGRGLLAWGPLRFFGWISFGIYLFHLPALNLVHGYTGLRSLPPRWEFAPLLVAVLLLSGAAATLSWLLVERPLLVERRNAPHRRVRTGRRSVSVVVAGGCAILAAVAVTSPFAASAGTAQGLFPRRVPDTSLSPISGPATPAQAVARGLVDPTEASLLAECSRRTGAAVRLDAAQWSVTASAFTCADADQARATVGRLAQWESSAGFGPLRHPQVGSAGVVMYHRLDPTTTSRPAVFHVRVPRGRWVVGLAVQAATPQAGRAAVRELLAAVRTPD